MKEFIHKDKEICENIWKLQKYFIFCTVLTLKLHVVCDVEAEGIYT